MLASLRYGKRTSSSAAGSKGRREGVGAVGCKQLMRGEEELSARQCRNADERRSVREAFHPSQVCARAGRCHSQMPFPLAWPVKLTGVFFLHTPHTLLFVHRKMTVA